MLKRKADVFFFAVRQKVGNKQNKAVVWMIYSRFFFYQRWIIQSKREKDKVCLRHEIILKETGDGDL
jgi:hypothetical protein